MAIIGHVTLPDPASAVARPMTVLAVATYEKGQEFLRECKRHGCRVLLITIERLKEADWPRESLDDTFYLPADATPEDIVKGVSWLARTEPIDRIVPLDDFDVETAALLREHLRVPGMGDSTARYFRDKLAMRVKARDHGIPVPPFVHVLHRDTLRRYMEDVPGPWVLKPRSQASAVGIRKISRPEQLWRGARRASATSSPSTCWSSTFPAMSSTWMPSSGSARSCSRCPTSTGSRRWTWRTRAASS